MKYIRVAGKECFCISEPVNYSMIKVFFALFPGRIVFTTDRDERIIGIISYAEFVKGLPKEKICINRNFKKIVLQSDYLAKVDAFFLETEYQSIPVLDVTGKLVECFYRKRPENVFGDKWINTANCHLAKLVSSKGYRKIKICLIDLLSERIYAYFKYYESYFDMVDKVYWYDVVKGKSDELLIVNEELKISLNLMQQVYSLYALQGELEYYFFLNKCKTNDVRLYIVNIPTLFNVWNVTKEEKSRIKAKIFDNKIWNCYLEEKEQYIELLNQVLDIKGDKEDFIESCLSLPPEIRKNQLYYMRENTGKYVNVINGNRVTVGVPSYVKNYIYLSGNSFVFGPLVDDEHTMASFLQRWLNQCPKYSGYGVVNEGIRGVPAFESIKRLNRDSLKSGDIVILFIDEKEERDLFKQFKIYHLEDVFNTLDRSSGKSYFIESPIHPNAFGYRLSADYLVRMLEEEYNDSWKQPCIMEDVPAIEEEGEYQESDEGLKEYLEELKKIAPIVEQKNGAIVMNCNPLTYGHKYLIEFAAKLVDHLYIFVVREDRSVFSFEERYEMVCACTEEFSNVTVLSSGQYIISAFTFPEYFTKQMAKPDTLIDTTNDVTIFGRFIAPILDIKVRFAGEEPTDFVTAQYNASMKRILPQYGIEFVEIPRYKREGNVISATKVRDAMRNDNWEQVKQLVPETTYLILRKIRTVYKERGN